MTSKQRVVIITGASRGIGATLAERFHGLGYGVLAPSRSITKTEPTVDNATISITGGIAEPDTAARVVDAAITRFGRLVAINLSLARTGLTPRMSAIREWHSAFLDKVGARLEVTLTLPHSAHSQGTGK